jgi:hypothetical protein
MKILRFGNSQDMDGRVPAEHSVDALLRKGLEAELGEPVEIVTRRAWPTPGLVPRVREWMDEIQPDVVLIIVLDYWFMYESVPVRMKRRFGSAGVKVGQAGQNVAQVSWLAHNRGFRTGRRLLTRLIGGEASFTPDEVVETMTACIKQILRHEGVILHVQGPTADQPFGQGRRAVNRLEQKRLRVTAQLAEVCTRYHVSYRGFPVPRWQDGPKLETSGDGLHLTARGNMALLEPYIRDVAAAIREIRGSGTAAAGLRVQGGRRSAVFASTRTDSFTCG